MQTFFLLFGKMAVTMNHYSQASKERYIMRSNITCRPALHHTSWDDQMEEDETGCSCVLTGEKRNASTALM